MITLPYNRFFLFCVLYLSIHFSFAQEPILIGTTVDGGIENNGLIYQINGDGTGHRIIYCFDSINGKKPIGTIIKANDGDIYGMTYLGGAFGEGVIYKYNIQTNTYSKLHDFQNANGCQPFSGSLFQASNGKMYGMTWRGGVNDYGVIFSFDPINLTYTNLYDFDYWSGAGSYGSFIEGTDGKLYGMARAGASGYGIVYQFNIHSNSFNVLHSFALNDGAYPLGSLVRGPNGILYGMTSEGGLASKGVIFSLNPQTNIFSKLFDFSDSTGANPKNSMIVSDDGNLYGISYEGGSSSCFFNSGCGMLFKFNTQTNSYSNVKDLNEINGSRAESDLFKASNGNIYGTTSHGGSAINGGLVFNYNPLNNHLLPLFAFNSDSVGISPRGLIELYSATKVDYQKDDLLINLYPNPTTGQLLITSDKNFDANILIYTSTGILLTEIRQALNNTIDISELSAGVYLLQVEFVSIHQKVVRRFIKM
ncbi:MAG TPA: choice-of-anchor tandem repeat GloVer-containing protein [Chitinophagales bacterium]|nr:choice-of-anchor tandem repeat GloVer-containing protein [Chitinophagales bacterium]